MTSTRIAAVSAELKKRDLDALIVTDLVNIHYLTGFRGSAALLVVDRSGAHFITDNRYTEIAEKAVVGARVLSTPMTKIDEWHKEFFKKQGYAKAAFEGSVAFSRLATIKKWVAPAKTKLAEHGDIVTGLRAIKNDAEVRIMAKAARIADAMMEAAMDAARVGVSELEISKTIRRAAEDLGAEGESFSNIVASGPNASRPHHSPSSRKLRAGDMVTIDLGARVEGYCSDLTRNPVIGRVPKRFAAIYDACLAAQQAGVAAIKPGVKCVDVDAIVREIIERSCFGEHFIHGTGHAVGLQIHEDPRLNKTSKATLMAGHVVTVEPGIYIPGFGGVRIEDLVLVTPKGHRVLSASPRELRVLPG